MLSNISLEVRARVLLSLTSSDLHFLVSSSALSPIPCLGCWGSDLIFRSPVLRVKAVSDVLQMDAILDPVLF
jgi:hypothetical protein